MTAGPAAAADRLRVQVFAADGLTRAGVLTLLRRARVPVAADRDWSDGTVIVAAAGSLERAIDACPPRYRLMRFPLLILASTVTRSGALSAVRAGAVAVLPTAETSPGQLRAALQSVQAGDARLPYRVLIHLIGGADKPEAPTLAPATLTARQQTVLELMAKGCSNAEIARALSCSEHTVKNVGYELMARLQARNRAHAVACGLRAGLI